MQRLWRWWLARLGSLPRLSSGVAEPAKFVPWRTVIAPCLQLLLISRFTLRPSGHETRTPDDELVVDPRSGME